MTAFYYPEGNKNVIAQKNITLDRGDAIKLAEKVASCVVKVTFPIADGAYLITVPKTNYKFGEPFETEGSVDKKCNLMGISH